MNTKKFSENAILGMISQADKAHCEMLQRGLYKTLDQLKFWYDTVRKQADDHQTCFGKVTFEPDGCVKTSSKAMPKGPDDFRRHEFDPYESLNIIVGHKKEAIKAFAFKIIEYFRTRYNLDIPQHCTIPEMPFDTYPTYLIPLKYIAVYLGGKGFTEKAEEEIMDKLQRYAHINSGWCKQPECNGRIISVYDACHFYSDNGLSSVNTVDRILAGMAFLAGGSLDGGIDQLQIFNVRNVDTKKWYQYDSWGMFEVRMYKNKRLDIRLHDEATARSAFDRMMGKC